MTAPEPTRVAAGVEFTMVDLVDEHGFPVDEHIVIIPPADES
jgi:hypothetical protein